MRAAHPWALSSWQFAGFNFTGRFYAPLDSAKTLTLATRFIADADACLYEAKQTGRNRSIFKKKAA